MQGSSKGISAKQVLALTVTNGCQGVMLTMPFTVAVYMVRSFLQEGRSSTTPVDEQLVGQLTGTLAAVYSFTQFTTSYAWGVVSNKIGRKPIMVLGSLISTAGLLWFGLAGSYASAAAARAVAGLLNGIIVAWKCMLGESCDSLTQGRVMSYMSLAWGVGCIAGPTIGGVLSQPCNTWPGLIGCGTAGFFQYRPYFLPCAVAAALSAVSLTFNIILLEETLPAVLARRKTRHHQQQQQQQPNKTTTAAAAAAGELKPVKHQLRRSYQRLMSNSASPYMAQVMRNQLQQQQPAAAAEAAAGADEFSLDSSNSSSSSSGWWSRAWESIRQQFTRIGTSSSSSSSRARYSRLQQPDLQQQQQQQHNALVELGLMQGGSDPAAGAHLAAEAGHQAAAAAAAAAAEDDSGAGAGATFRDSNVPQQQQQQQQQQQGLKQQSEELSDSEDAVLLVHDGSITSAQHHHQQQQQQWQQQQQLGDVTECQDQGTEQGAYRLDQSTKQPQQQQQQQALAAAASSGRSGPWYKQRAVVLSLLGYGNTCLLFCALDELTPMFASAPINQGGLHLQEVQLAGPLAFGGLCLMIISLLAYPPLQRSLGTLPLTRIGLILAVITSLAIPSARLAASSSSSDGGVMMMHSTDSVAAAAAAAAAANIGHLTRGVSHSSSSGIGGRRLLNLSDLYMSNQSVTVNPPVMTFNNLSTVNGSSSNVSSSSSNPTSSSGFDIGLGAWAVLYIAMLLKAAAGCAAFTGSMILVNSLPAADQLGQVNGVGQSLASLARGIGPALGGILWGATVHVQLPGAQLLPYAVVACSAVAGWVLYHFIEMPAGVEAGRQQQQQGSSCCQE